MPIFTKRHYREIARAMHRAKPPVHADIGPRASVQFQYQWRQDIRRLAVAFAGDNANFDPNTFLQACKNGQVRSL